MAKSKVEETVNALSRRVDLLEKEVEALKAFSISEKQEPEQPKRSSLIFR